MLQSHLHINVIVVAAQHQIITEEKLLHETVRFD
jgi:hypothetical protein